MPLAASAYGKDNVRLLKVWRDPSNPQHQKVCELRVCVLLEGEIEKSYTEADNSPIVPTDTVKQTIYILGKQNDVWPIETFGATLVDHFLKKYSWIHGATAEITQYRWTRYNVQGKPHPHSFIQDGAETRVCKVFKKKESDPFTIVSGLKGLTVLKSTGSMFHGFNTCDFTILKDAYDRILSTDVDATWTWSASKTQNLSQVKALTSQFDVAFEGARNITLETFALENSASVQATMYNMSNLILKAVPELHDVGYTLPNKHYFELDLSWHHGLKNTGKDATVYSPQSDPNGLIKCTVTRASKAKL